jgi:hypothetical protein
MVVDVRKNLRQPCRTVRMGHFLAVRRVPSTSAARGCGPELGNSYESRGIKAVGKTVRGERSAATKSCNASRTRTHNAREGQVSEK